MTVCLESGEVERKSWRTRSRRKQSSIPHICQPQGSTTCKTTALVHELPNTMTKSAAEFSQLLVKKNNLDCSYSFHFLCRYCPTWNL